MTLPAPDPGAGDKKSICDIVVHPVIAVSAGDCFAGRPPDPPMAISIMHSPEDRVRIDEMRLRSYKLSVARGHMRRG